MRLLLATPLVVFWLAQQATAPASPLSRPDSARDSLLEARVGEVAASLRCPVCQNLSIQDSPSELAQDMKRIVREQLVRGATPDQVRQYFVARYGEWVLLEPPAKGVNLAVWALPALVLIGGAVLVWAAVRRWVQPAPAAAGAPAPPPVADPGELLARRARLVSALEELEADFADTKVTAGDYDLLRQRDEAELRAVKAALKERPKRAAARPAPAAVRRSINPVVAWSLGVVAFGAVVALTLTRSVAPRAAGGTITGIDLSGGAAPDGGADGAEGGGAIAPVDTARLHVLEARVARDSNDHAALVELGHLYLSQQRLNRSAQVNMRAVRLKPDARESAEAFAHLGMILWNAGETDAGLQSLDKALELHPDFPEALLFKGIVLFAGKRDMAGATQAWERYLQVAPADANTARVRAMLEGARRAAGSSR